MTTFAPVAASAAPPLTVDDRFGRRGATVKHVGLDALVTEAIAQPDGKLLVAAMTPTAPDTVLMRFTAAGTLDPTFGTRGVLVDDPLGMGLRDAAFGAALHADGTIVTAGNLDSDPSSRTDDRVLVARYTKQGKPDRRFGTQGLVTIDVHPHARFGAWVNDAVAAPGGATLVVGTSEGARAWVARITRAGALDRSFGRGGYVELPAPVATQGISAVVDAAGAIYVAGTSQLERKGRVDRDLYVGKLTPDGRVDTTFGSDGSVLVDAGTPNDRTNSIRRLRDGSLAIAASTRPTNVDLATIALLGPDGTPDRSFGGTGFVRSTQLEAPTEADVAELADGTLALGGTLGRDFGFELRDRTGTLRTKPVGVNVDEDATGAASYDEASKLAVAPDGSLYAAGVSVDDSGLRVAAARLRYSANA